MTKIASVFAFGLVSATFGCSGKISDIFVDDKPYSPTSPRYVDPSTYDPPAHVAIGVWVEEHPQVDAGEVLRGCNFWSTVGLECFATDESHADLLVREDLAACVPLENGTRIIGRGGSFHGHGLITIYPDCFTFGQNQDVPPGFMAHLAAHEGGHTLGMTHVPNLCDGSDEANPIFTHPNGTPICGEPAVMNPSIGYPLTAITELDTLIFEVREPGGLFPTGTEGELADNGDSATRESTACEFVVFGQ